MKKGIIIASSIVAILFVAFIISTIVHVKNSNKQFKEMQAEKEALHNQIISEHIRNAEYADSLHSVVETNIEANKAQAKATSAKVDANFKLTLKLLKQRQDEERNNVLGTSIDSTISNVRKYFPN